MYSTQMQFISHFSTAIMPSSFGLLELVDVMDLPHSVRSRLHVSALSLSLPPSGFLVVFSLTRIPHHRQTTPPPSLPFTSLAPATGLLSSAYTRGAQDDSTTPDPGRLLSRSHAVQLNTTSQPSYTHVQSTTRTPSQPSQRSPPRLTWCSIVIPALLPNSSSPAVLV